MGWGEGGRDVWGEEGGVDDVAYSITLLSTHIAFDVHHTIQHAHASIRFYLFAFLCHIF